MEDVVAVILLLFFVSVAGLIQVPKIEDGVLEKKLQLDLRGVEVLLSKDVEYVNQAL